LQNALFADSGAKFRVIVTNGFGSATSNEATLTVNAPPSITGQPANQTVTQGQPATFGVTANGSATLTYQWQRNQVNIAGATSATYTIGATALSDNGAKYRCVVTNSFGTATSNEATLTVQPPPPILLTEANSNLAIALDSVTMFRDPFPLTTPFNFSGDGRTRVSFFALNLDLLPDETVSAVTARAEDSTLNVYPMTIEFVGSVPAVPGVSEGDDSASGQSAHGPGHFGEHHLARSNQQQGANQNQVNSTPAYVFLNTGTAGSLARIERAARTISLASSFLTG
jgi:hypothetical protein